MNLIQNREIEIPMSTKYSGMTVTYPDLCKEYSNNSINNDSQVSFCLEGLNKIGIGERKLNKAPLNTELKSQTVSV